MTEPNVILEVRFLTTAEGGRRGDLCIVPGIPYGCPVFVDGEGFDCRFLIDEATLELGKTYQVPIRFLYPELALRKMSVGTPVRLWEGKDIAFGKVVQLS